MRGNSKRGSSNLLSLLVAQNKMLFVSFGLDLMQVGQNSNFSDIELYCCIYRHQLGKRVKLKKILEQGTRGRTLGEVQTRRLKR